ncbi:MAG: rhodanese-like domain-containing protein [Gammaproteobacteria bacterium]|nr:rhodanese-like domain-containing protein [Gammaproteobacteria bacterium]NKB62950.1 rhodanese-like domain-containing protein [Gammaproteobacteria bacterium]
MIVNADNAVTTLTPEDVDARRMKPGTLVVDIRDIRELEREGRIPGTKHIPRGMLEFWMHPDSPYFKDYFEDAEEVILHCNRGWRSALAAKALLDIGIEVAHMDGGFTDWLQKDLPTESYVKG